MNIQNKKGEVTTQQIVIIIVLVISFAIILFFLWKLNLQETTEQEICHNSVVTRGNSALKEMTPLNCQTNYICITKDGSCEELTNPKVFEVEKKDEIFKILADEIYNCWWMFGEGKVNYVGSDLTENLYCSICSQIYFDNSLKEIEDEELKAGIINQEGLYNFLTTEKVKETQTYAEYLYDTNDLEEIKDILEESNVEFGNINIDKQQYIVMGITSKVSKLKWVGIGTAVVAGEILFWWAPITPGKLTLVTGLISFGTGAAAGAGGYFVGTTVLGESGNEYLSPSIVEVNSETFDKLQCKDVSTLA